MYDQTEVTAILHEHARRYPHMQPTDAVKLLYQSEFGGGHLITNPAHSLARLQNEMQATAPNADLPLLEPIGNGLVRLSLAAANANKISPQIINEAFVRSAAAVNGTLPGFLNKLQLLQTLCEANVFAFSPAALSDYLAAYAAQGYPMVSHSPTYRALYHPAYRVMLTSLLPSAIL
jgi:hypothetical protein